jgi:hypothetical protein
LSRVLEDPPDEVPGQGATTGTPEDARISGRSECVAGRLRGPALDEQELRRVTVLLLDEFEAAGGADRAAAGACLAKNAAGASATSPVRTPVWRVRASQSEQRAACPRSIPTAA